MVLTADQLQAHLDRAPTRVREQWPYLWRTVRMRPDQDPCWDDDWDVRLLMMGRGAGKTRGGSEAIGEAVRTGLVLPGQLVAIVGRTLDDAHGVMIEGKSGLLRVGPPQWRPSWSRSVGRGRLVWPNGVEALVYSAQNPNALRGPEFALIWADEVAAWPYLDSEDNSPWDNMTFANRDAGSEARIIASTTPRGSRFMRDLVKDPTTRTTVASTYINEANLSVRFIRRIRAKYDGTRIGEQEIHARLLDEAKGAVFRRGWITRHRRPFHPLVSGDPTAGGDVDLAPVMVVVGVDPAGSESATSSFTGIVVVALTRDGVLEVWDDLSLKGSPAKWSDEVVRACKKWGTRTVIAEGNYGADMVFHTLRTAPGGRQLQIVKVWAKAKQGKVPRAEPIAARFEKGTARLRGEWPDLEDEMTLWEPESSYSPDRMDAMVWAMRHLDPSLSAGFEVPEMRDASVVGPSRHRLT